VYRSDHIPIVKVSGCYWSQALSRHYWSR